MSIEVYNLKLQVTLYKITNTCILIILLFLRFLYVFQLIQHEETLIDGYFANFITSGPKKSKIKTTLIQHILEMDDDSPKDQFSILSSILNNHTYGYPSLKEGGHQVKNITYAEHVFYEDKFSKIGIDGERIRTYILPSPRNRIMHFLDTDKKGDLYQLVKHILKDDKIGLQPDEEIPQMVPTTTTKEKEETFILAGFCITKGSVC